MTTDYFWEDDICWCADSDECKKTECFRHLDNRRSEPVIFTMAHLKYTEYCSRKLEEEVK